MKITLTIFLLLQSLFSYNQIPPTIQLQRCYGGSSLDALSVKKIMPDGGYLLTGGARSTDGDITFSHGLDDAWIVRTDASGTIIWQKTYGGFLLDGVNDIEFTQDGGYIFLGRTNSNDGDVSGFHGGVGDCWLVKLNSIGNIQWQKCLGGPGTEYGGSMQLTMDGGYIIATQTTADGGDVSGHHGILNPLSGSNDIWVVKTDALGNIQWQRCYGGTDNDANAQIIQTADGGYLLCGSTRSQDGDITCVGNSIDMWILRLTGTGTIVWQKCVGGNATDIPRALVATLDGGFITTGIANSPTPNGTGTGDAWVTKFDALGNVQWQRFIGGTSLDEFYSIIQIPDGSYMAAGRATSVDGDICSTRGGADYFIVHLNNDGTTAWTKTYGGSMDEAAGSILQTLDGGFLVGGYSYSNNGDVSGNHGQYDAWIVKLGFPGVPLLSTISIVSGKATICPGKPLTLIATVTDGGASPSYNWKLNGTALAMNNDTIQLNNLNDGDIISCELTSNSPCVTTQMAKSNTITVDVDQTLAVSSFLPSTLFICAYGGLEIKSTGNFKSYSWNTNATTTSIKVDQPGLYWLDVLSINDCPARDTVMVIPKDCPIGLYVPTAFTPNNDGKNDVLRPTLGGKVVKYEFTIYDRYGQMVFMTKELNKGWDGKRKSQLTDSQVFVWVCKYQFTAEPERTEKGTVVLVK